MVKILMGLAAVVVIAVGGFFGFEFYTQHRITSEVEAAFAQIRAGGGKASHGKVSFDLKSRTLRIDDIATESATQPPVQLEDRQPHSLGCWPAGYGAILGRQHRNVGHRNQRQHCRSGRREASPTRCRKSSMKDYSGPATLHQPPASASIIEMYRSALEQFAAVSAASVSVPSITGTVNFGAVLSGDFTYSGMALQDIKGGKIAAMQIERANFHGQYATGRQGRQNDRRDRQSQLPAISMQTRLPRSSIRRRPMTTAITASTAKHRPVPTPSLQRWACACASTDDHRWRRRATVTAATASVACDDAGGRGSSPTPAQTREMIDKMAALYEGMRIGTAEMRGLSAETPQGPFKLQAIRFNLEDGKIGEFALEGLDTSTPKGPLKLGRFALKSLDIANFMRMSAQFANPAQPPSPELIAGLFPLIGGIEIKGVTAPFKNTGKFVNLDGFDVNWGQFVGPIPSKARADRENNHAGRCDRSLHESAHRGRAGYAFGRWRYRRGMDRGGPQLRCGRPEARNRRAR